MLAVDLIYLGVFPDMLDTHPFISLGICGLVGLVAGLWPMRKPRIHALLGSEQELASLRGQVRELRTYSTPLASGDGGFSPCYRTLLIGTSGELQEIDMSNRFGDLEVRAATLARHLGVPLVSEI